MQFPKIFESAFLNLKKKPLKYALSNTGNVISSISSSSSVSWSTVMRWYSAAALIDGLAVHAMYRVGF